MYVSSPEEIRAKLEAGRAAIASRLHALADEIEAHRLGDDRVTPVDRLGLVPRELHRNRPRHARALRARVSCWHCSSEQARTHPGTRAAIRQRRHTVAGVERSVNPLRLLLRAGMGWGKLPAGTAAGNFLVVAAGRVGGEVVDTDDDGTEQ